MAMQPSSRRHWLRSEVNKRTWAHLGGKQEHEERKEQMNLHVALGFYLKVAFRLKLTYTAKKFVCFLFFLAEAQ